MKAADAAARVRASEGAGRTALRPAAAEPSTATAAEPSTATAGRAARLAACRVVLENSGGLQDLEAQVDAAWRSRLSGDNNDGGDGDEGDDNGGGGDGGGDDEGSDKIGASGTSSERGNCGGVVGGANEYCECNSSSSSSSSLV